MLTKWALASACLAIPLLAAGCRGTSAGAPPDDRLRILSLNLAHGRGLAPHQILLPRATIEKNLQNVADLILRERPHVVALQEADGPSTWSAEFDHVAELARLTGYPHHFRGDHASSETDKERYSYGTAILSILPLRDPASIRFEPEPPLPAKGLVRAAVEMPGSPEQAVLVVSLHFDPFRFAARQRQAQSVATILREPGMPIVIAGDFNTEWSGKDRTLRTLAGRLALQPPDPDAGHTYHSVDPERSLDWILAGTDLEITTYRVLEARVSDHLAVLAEVRLR